MDISKKEMESYHRLLSQIQERSKSTFSRLVEAGLKANPNMDDGEFLKLVENSMISTTLSFGDAAGTVALDFFDDAIGIPSSKKSSSDVPLRALGYKDDVLTELQADRRRFAAQELVRTAAQSE